MNDVTTCRPDWRHLLGRTVLLACWTAVAWLAVAPRLPAAERTPGRLPQRPNVVFIAVEDFSPQRLHCYGGPVHSPNMDRLASQGVLFELAYCMSPVCNASRTSLLTGLRPDTTRVFSNGHDWRKMLPDVTPMPVHFRRHGYDTVRIGKIYHGLYKHDASWTRQLPELHDPRAARPRKKAVGPKNPVGPQRVPLVWGPTGNPPEKDRDGQIAEQAVRFLKEKHPRPFFFAIGFHSPHLPFRAPDQFFDLYDVEKIRLPQNPPDDLADTPIRKPSNDQLSLTEPEWREAVRAHYACISYVDWCVGKILDALDQTGLADKTIVVLWSDHGFMLGEHFLWRKVRLYEESARVAFIWRVPGVTPAGARCSRPVETIDTFPTLFDLCGLPQPERVEGISMKSLLQNPDRPWKKGAITWRAGNGTQVAIQTERYRLNKQLTDGFLELYDHRVDPHEFTNRARDPKYADVVQRLSKLLEGNWRACLPDE